MNQRFKPNNQSRAATTSIRWPKVKLLVLAGLCVLPAYGLLSIGLQGGSWLPAAAYSSMSAVAFALYGYDKKRARTGERRIPEKVLHASELLGGWPGALLAQQVFRHKTRKLSYQSAFWLIVTLHLLFWIDRVLLGGNFLSRHFY